MKTRIAIAFLLSLSFGAPAFAQAGDGSRMLERLSAADTNNDGAVSLQEVRAQRAGQFSRLDRNGDGYFVADEIPRFAQQRAGMDLNQLVTQFDANHDGRVSQSEFVNGPTMVFDRVDANGDDVVTQAVLDAARANVRAAQSAAR
jgi:Ca2+-binding EF-hand superfamily protein